MSLHFLFRTMSVLVVGALFTAMATSVVAQDTTELEDKALRAAAAKVAKSVVRIETFGGLEKVGKLLVGTGPTTGLIVSEDGYVISSAFNFVQKPTSILVTLPNGERKSAEIISRDDSRMLVMLKVNEVKDALPTPETVSRKDLTVGQWTVAVGRTFSPDDVNLSVGILSATNRIWGKAVQTDAKVSPVNYGGPLVDIEGRVIGVLVPLSPQAGGEVAGAEWYDSGIGFAAPLDEVMSHFDQLREGKDLKPGVLGITLGGADMYSGQPVVASVAGNSPAEKSGMEKGDKIVVIDGQPIVRQAQLKHALGPKYAGDEVNVTVKRGDKDIELSVTLTDEIRPFEHPFIGVLPMRDAMEKGVVVRYVYPESPASVAGVAVGDTITHLNDQEIPDAGSFQDMLSTVHGPGDKVNLKVKTKAGEKTVEVTLASLPLDLPAELPAAFAKYPEEGEAPATGVVDFAVLEEANEIFGYVPEDYKPDAPHGLLVYLQRPGGEDKDEIVDWYKEMLTKNHMIMLAPASADPEKWEPTETDVITKAIDGVMKDYNIDRSRIVVYGYQSSGAMAYLTGFTQRELVRGVVAVNAPLPTRANPSDNDPLQRLAFVITRPEEVKEVGDIDKGAEKIRAKKFPVTMFPHRGAGRQLEKDEFQQVMQWMDTLDRI